MVLICISLMMNDVEHLHVSVGPLYTFFGKMFMFLFLIGCEVCFVLVLSCISAVYTLDINPLSDISLANMFSHLVGCFFVLWNISFALQNLFFGVVLVVYFCFCVPCVPCLRRHI